MILSTLIIESSHIGWGTATALVVEFGLRVALVLVLLARRGISPETRVTWIILILALPVVGVFIYLMVGEAKFGRTRIRRHRKVIQTVEESNCHADTTPGMSALHELRRHQRQLALLAEQVSKSGPLRGNDIRLLGDTTLTAHQIIEDIDASTESCHFLFYIWLDDEIGTAVGEACQGMGGICVALSTLVSD